MAMKMLFGYNFGKLSVAVIPAGQDKADRDDWQEIDPASLPDALGDLYQEYKDAYSLAKDAREAFEAAMRDAAGIKAPVKVAKAGAKARSLADFLKAQEAGGHRA